jgi:hypothetical protein
VLFIKAVAVFQISLFRAFAIELSNSTKSIADRFGRTR